MSRIIRRIIGGLCIVTSLLVTSIPARYIEASNAREDYLMDNSILVDYTGTASTVSVSGDVKIIGEEAFANNDYINSANLGNVKEIRHGAFANCRNLTSVKLPNSVETIEAAAFSGCTALKNVSFGKNVEEIGDGVFAGCYNLAGISVPSKNPNFRYEAGVLYDNNKEKVYSYLCANPYEIYYMPNSVFEISPYSFWGNNDLEEVYLSSKLNEVPAYSFSNCRSLKEVQIPYSVNSIDAKAFENCISLKDVEIPASVTYIDPTAFDGCYNLNIIAEPGTVAYEFFKNFEMNDIAASEMMDSAEIIRNNDNTVSDHKAEEYISGTIDASHDPSNVDWMPSVNPLIQSEDSSVFGKTIVVNGRAVFFVNREMEINQIEREDYDSNDTVEIKDDEKEKESYIYDSGKGGSLPKYTYVNKKIVSQAYYASTDKDDFVIPEGTKKIGRFAFARSTIDSAIIPEGVEEIGYGAFYHCNNLKNVSIPSSVKYIDGYAFANTPFNEIIHNNSEKEYYVVGDGILIAYSGNDKYLKIPEGVKTIVAGCFENNENIESVILPETLKLIDSDAFRGCTSLEAVVGGKNIEKIGDRAFMDCPIVNYIVPASVNEIGLRAFDYSNTNIEAANKIIGFEGMELPKTSYDETSSRLNNREYRNDALYNVLFAVVDSNVDNFDDTVLDNDTLGFSGIIVSKEKNSEGNPTGYMNVRKSYVYSEEVLNSLPDTIHFNNEEYIIKDKENIMLSVNPYTNAGPSKNVNIKGENLNGFKASLSEEEYTGAINILTDDTATIILNNAYANLFGGEILNNLTSYKISLTDDKNVVNINRFGKTLLNITVPVDGNYTKYHVITLDEDGQLEELPAFYNSQDKNVTFSTSHLSYFGIYGNEKDNVVINIKDGKLVKEYRLDSSPDTGDYSLPVYYVAGIGLLALGLFLLLIKPKKKI